jgi:hypothetical protein
MRSIKALYPLDVGYEITRTKHIRTRTQKSIKKGKDTRVHRSPRQLPDLERMLDSTLDS